MVVFACLDDKNGMLFNHRRQSRDAAVIEDMFGMTEGKLWMNSYSAKLFGAYTDRIVIEDDPAEYPPECNCFFEDISLKLYEDKIDTIIIYYWNRIYPADTYMDIDLEQGWRITDVKEFGGKSHEKITRKTYEREI